MQMKLNPVYGQAPVTVQQTPQPPVAMQLELNPVYEQIPALQLTPESPGEYVNQGLGPVKHSHEEVWVTTLPSSHNSIPLSENPAYASM